MKENQLIIVGSVSGYRQRSEVNFIAEVASVEQHIKSLALQTRDRI